MKVLIASCIRQHPDILREFLESLDRLEKPCKYSYYFITDLKADGEKVLSEWVKGKPVEVEKVHGEEDFVVDETTHRWNSKLVDWMMTLRNKYLQKAIKGDYDYVFAVDSDYYLHPKTLTQLLSRKKDVITEINWTRWYPKDRLLPNVWFFDNYGFPADGLKRLRTEELVEIGGFGGIALISKKALKAGVSYSRLSNLNSEWGEDRHFCVRALSLELKLWVDTFYPAFHIYRMTDLPRLKGWKQGFGKGFEVVDCRWATRSDRDKDEFRRVVDEIEVHGSLGEASWSRCWEYPYVYLNSDLQNDMKVLDVGCGDSPLKLLLSEICEVHCIDERTVKVPDNIIFKKCDMVSIPYPDNYFDRVFCVSVLEHSQAHPIRYVDEMLRILKTDGKLLLTLDVNRWSTQFRFRPRELQRFFRELGAELPLEPEDALKSEEHPDGKKVGEGLSVIGLTIKKLSHITQKTEATFPNVPKVLISVPHTGELRAELVVYLLNVVARSLRDGKIRISVDLSWGMPVDSSRNAIVKTFLETDNDWLLMIDHDIQPPDNVLEELLKHNKKVVGAVCWSSMSGEKGKRWEKFGIPYPVIMKKNPKGGWNVDRKTVASGKRLIEVDAASTACILLHRKVLESIEPPWFKLQYDEFGVCNAGEDFTFFEKVKAKGYRVYVDLALQCGHYKTLDIKQFNDLLAETERKTNV